MKKQNWTMLRIFTIALCTLWWATANAADYKVEWINPQHTIAELTITGEILRTDGIVWANAANEAVRARAVTVKLDSLGGDVVLAQHVGLFIHARGWDTLVPDNVSCVSACALIWLAGKTLWWENHSHIGFHRSRRPDGKSLPSGDKHVIDYLKLIGMSDAVIAYALSVPPTGMRWLTDKDAKTLQLNTILWREQKEIE
jgi:hypothetical protein